MSARLPLAVTSPCPLADAANHATPQDAQEAHEAAIDAHVKEAYGPGYVPEFAEQALKAAPLNVLQKICAASDRLGPSYHEGRNDTALMDAGGALLDWLLEFAYQRAEQDLATK
ncbi:hypothetical protein N0K08_17535 [Acidovorax sp. Be4]|uniref:DUF3077 domain-containing protein n=1 Tax=Acidovorax bellezanensis TaxID=2976702 RepID=A0ABT2PRN1_9BURK|nr:hypothetical protein [Acidovorax sp. Be4]MCT9812449.1 hypothetical protein [Acidovorax sp. Be4]